MTRYVLRALWNSPEDSIYTSAKSNVIIVTCLNPQLQINIAPTEYTVKEGGKIKFKGSVVDEYGNSVEGDTGLIFYVTTPSGNQYIESITPPDNDNIEFEYIFSEKGDYTVYFTVNQYTSPTGETYNANTSNDIKIKCGIIETKLTLTSDRNTKTDYGRCNVDDKVNLKAKIVTSDNKPLPGKKINFFTETPSYKLLGSVTTSADGVASLILPVSIVGDNKYKVQFDGDDQYKTSTSKNYTINAIKHSTKFMLDNPTIYNGWKVRGKFVDEQERGIGYTEIHLTIIDPTNNTKLFDQTIRTKEGGIFESSPLNPTSNTSTLNVILSFTDSTGRYESITSNQETINYSPQISYKTITFNIINASSKIPYRSWTNLDNIHEGGKYIQCGSSCKDAYAIAGRNGTRHTPAPLKINNFNFDIPDEVMISSIKVSIKTRNRSCSSASAQIKIPRPTIAINSTSGGKKATFNNGNEYIPLNTFTTCFTTFENINLASTILNDPNFYVYISFSKNTSTNIGILDIQEINVEMNYIPIQVGGT